MRYDNFNVPRGTIENYINLLKIWNAKINLVSFKTEEELINRHVLDSLQLIKYICKEEEVFDIGSGAGFPGLMLSYAGVKKVSLVEKVAKKAAFLNVASCLSEGKVKVYNQDVETLEVGKCDLITARGFADLETIFKITSNLTGKKTRFLLLKGRNVKNEEKKASENWSFECIMHESETSEDSCILEIRNLIKK